MARKVTAEDWVKGFSHLLSEDQARAIRERQRDAEWHPEDMTDAGFILGLEYALKEMKEAHWEGQGISDIKADFIAYLVTSLELEHKQRKAEEDDASR